MSSRKTVRRNRKIFAVVSSVLLFIYSLSLVGALFWALTAAFKMPNELLRGPFDWPLRFSTGVNNFVNAFSELYTEITLKDGSTRVVLLPELFFNTFAYALGCTLFATLSPCVVAYAVAKYRFPGRNLIYSIVIVTMILPIIGSLPSEMQIVNAIGFMDNIFGIWLMKGTFLGMYFLIFYASFKSLSWEYAEAAFIDGASHLRVMARIMLPLVFPTIVAVGLLIFIGFFNDYMTQLLYLPSMPSVSYTLWDLVLSGSGNSGNSGAQVPIQMAGCILISLPIFVLYMIFKKQMIGNLSVGGIKG